MRESVEVGPWWRWPIYIVATFSTFMAAYWLVTLPLVGSMMGWGGRSSSQIVLFIGMIVLVPFALTVALALKAVVEAQKRHLRVAGACSALSLFTIPLVWLTEQFRMLPF